MRITITAGANTYLIAGESHAHTDGNFQGRLLNEINLTEALNTVGAMPVTLNLSIRNDDGYILRSVDLWAALVVIEADGGQAWAGKITAYDNDSDGVLRVVATERAAPEIEMQIPDEVARLVTVDENFHTSAVNVTLPLVVGGTVAAPHLIKGILIDKTAGIYLLCVGEIHQVVKVYRGTEELSTGFTAYTGTAGQASYPGFAYVAIAEAQRLNDDGSYVEISAEIVGLKLGASTIDECRNGARFLQYLLTTAATGACGWGLGISEDDIDTDSFTTAISRLDTASLRLDGVFYFRQSAQSWIDQICQSIRGSYSIGADGKRRLFVNASGSSVKTYDESNMRVLRDGKGAYTGRVYNKGKLDYGYNPITGMFMQSAQYENSTSIGAIGEQEFYGQSYLIKDAATAQAILEYNCKKSLIGAEKVLFETIELAENARVGDIITITHPAKSLTGDWQITSLEIGDYLHNIEAEKFSADIFAVGSPGTAIDWVTDAPIIPSITPGAASGLTLSSGIRPGTDGTNIVVLSGTFTPPASAYLAASIEYGEGALPILDWKSLGMVQGNSFEVVPVKPAQLYAVRIRMISSTGKSDYVTATITTQGDDVPPGQPSISATSYLKNVSAIIALGTVPSDLAGFQIFRHTANNSALASLITSVSSKDGRAEYHEVYQGNYGDTLYYWAKAFDTWGNVGAFSAAAGPLTIAAIEGADIVDAALNRSALFAAGVVDATAIGTAAATEAKIAANAITSGKISNAALSMPAGPVAAWTAKGATTASIAEVNGVRDIAGNGRHGRAVGGTAVVDSDKGKAFSFDGIDDVIEIVAAPFRGVPAFSVAMWIKTAGLATGMTRNSYWTNQFDPVAFAPANGRMYFGVNNGVNAMIEAIDPTSHFDDQWHHFTCVADGTTIKIYRDGIQVSSVACIGITWTEWGQPFYFGRNPNRSSYFGKFLGNGMRQFNRALTAAEVKTLYMMTEDATFGTITADLLTTGELITASAQIKNTIINDAHIANLSAAKLNAGYIAAARIEGGTITGAKLAAGTITTRELLIGAPGSALNEDPGFLDASAWSITFGTITVISDGVVGSGCVQGTRVVATSAKLIPFNSDRQYRVTAWVRGVSAGIATRLLVRYYDHAGTFLAYSTYSDQNSSSGKWFRAYRIISGVPPAGTKFIAVYADVKNVSVATVSQIQDLRIEEVLPATLIQDGAIITEKLAVGAVKAGNIYAGAVETAKLDANAVTADKIAAGAITADKINVAALKAPSGAVGSWNAKGATNASIVIANGVKDTSGNNNHATATAGVTVGRDTVKDSYFLMNAGTERLNISTPVTAGVVTMSIWVHRHAAASTSYKALFCHASVDRDHVIFNPSWVLGVFDGTVRLSTYTLPADSAWHMITVVLVSETSWALYVDGAYHSTIVTTLNLTTYPVGCIGGHPTQAYYPGYIADPVIFPRALTAAEIKTLYMLGTDSESGTITADRVVTGQIKSLNYSTTAGSMIDLDDGTIALGGSSNPDFYVAEDGAMTCTKGFIAGLQILANTLTGHFYDGATTYQRVSLSAPIDSTTPKGLQMYRVLSNNTQSYVVVQTGVGASARDAPFVAEVTNASMNYGLYTNARIYAGGGFYPPSDERVKNDIEDVSVLSGVRGLRVKKYHLDEYKIKRLKYEKQIEKNLKESNIAAADDMLPVEPDVENYNPCKSIGVMAQDFNKAFGIGHNNEETYNLTDAIGVALRAIQELAEIVDDLKAENIELRAALNLPEKQKEQAAEFTVEEIEKAADAHVKTAYDNIMQELKQ